MSKSNIQTTKGLYFWFVKAMSILNVCLKISLHHLSSFKPRQLFFCHWPSYNLFSADHFSLPNKSLSPWMLCDATLRRVSQTTFFLYRTNFLSDVLGHACIGLCWPSKTLKYQEFGLQKGWYSSIFLYKHMLSWDRGNLYYMIYMLAD